MHLLGLRDGDELAESCFIVIEYCGFGAFVTSFAVVTLLHEPEERGLLVLLCDAGPKAVV